MAKVDHYEIKRLNDEIEMLQEKVNNHQDVINRFCLDIHYCVECDFAKTEDNLTGVDNGELSYCEPCVDKCIERGEVGVCQKCRYCFTDENLEEIDDELYCDDCSYHR